MTRCRRAYRWAYGEVRAAGWPRGWATLVAVLYALVVRPSLFPEDVA